MCSTKTPTFSDNNTLSNNLHNNLFLPGFSSSPGWLLVTRTRGAWWCRYRGHWRSGPESVHKNGILKTFTHISIPKDPCILLNKQKTIAKPPTHQVSDTWSLMMSYRGYWRSGPRHLSPRSRVCPQEWHRKNKSSLTHSFPSTHAHSSNKLRAKPSTDQTWRLPSVVLLLSNVVVADFQEAWHLLLRTAPCWRPCRQGQYWQ